nr:MAG TPA: hypothetical protein [Caudoviricetes sp.]
MTLTFLESSFKHIMHQRRFRLSIFKLMILCLF